MSSTTLVSIGQTALSGQLPCPVILSRQRDELWKRQAMTYCSRVCRWPENEPGKHSDIGNTNNMIGFSWKLLHHNLMTCWNVHQPGLCLPQRREGILCLWWQILTSVSTPVWNCRVVVMYQFSTSEILLFFQFVDLGNTPQEFSWQ